MSKEQNRDLVAAKNMDWMQVVLNQGPPCFHVQNDGLFCGRAREWDGHKTRGGLIHKFRSLADLLHDNQSH
jgi:hypothetical protein